MHFSPNDSHISTFHHEQLTGLEIAQSDCISVESYGWTYDRVNYFASIRDAPVFSFFVASFM